jgi:hypothetical protein
MPKDKSEYKNHTMASLIIVSSVSEFGNPDICYSTLNKAVIEVLAY